MSVLGKTWLMECQTNAFFDYMVVIWKIEKFDDILGNAYDMFLNSLKIIFIFIRNLYENIIHMLLTIVIIVGCFYVLKYKLLLRI